jgi:dTMP kinase
MGLYHSHKELIILFITFEGIDGCGKSTQARMLASWLESLGLKIILTREPGGTPLANEIRNLILCHREEEVSPITEVLLYATSRAQHVSNLIIPSLEAGKTVICDRFFHSSLAFQGYGLGYDISSIQDINRYAMQDVFPDMIILLDISPEDANERISAKKKDRIESRDLEFHRRVRNGYLAEAKKNCSYFVIDASLSADEVHEWIKKIYIMKKWRNA